MTIEIAQTAEQYAAFASLAREYEDDLPEPLRHKETAEQLSAPAVTFGEPNAAFVCTVEGRPAGCVALFRHDAETAIMGHLYVSHEFRGRGIARALVSALIAEAARRGYQRIALDTEPLQLTAAYRLYLSLGFEECAPHAPLHYEHAICMQLLIGAQAPVTER